jgi:hypothetical protein
VNTLAWCTRKVVGVNCIFDDSKKRRGQCRREHVKRRQVRLQSVVLRVVMGNREMEGVAMRMLCERVCRQLRFVVCEHVTQSTCTCKQPSNPPEAAREGCTDPQLDALPSKPTWWPGPVGLLSKPRRVCVVARGCVVGVDIIVSSKTSHMYQGDTDTNETS